MRGFAILLGFYFLGAILHEFLGIPLPANVIGLILFTLSLFLGWIRLEWVEAASGFLIKHMLLLFTPFVVGTMVFFDRIGQEAIPLILTLAGSTFGVLFITGWTVRLAGAAGKQEGGEAS
ncbi:MULTISPECIES: CidA/LrgA family protein [Paenibacillus]|uniref:CidA/LrgA family protein n=1 Tax=Paenibacillus TaxID=44249 RepID=UPI0022B88992|nr:CidA/LrgA family protein [Paenibacillus caseinilyticus]MCZ8521493.1 CidA/LrgA family protein [Paenibacillus caseinilyticus]